MASDAAARNAYFENAFKTIATNIRFASVDKPVKVLTVTSSVPNEGKSTIAMELARALAGGGNKVLLVEGDMRWRSLASMVGAHPCHGIYAVLSGQVPLSSAVVETSDKGLYFLDSEPNMPNPVDIISSKSFRGFLESARNAYDYVVIDTPPLSAFVDASVFASMADGSVLVVRKNFVKRDDLESAYGQLKKAKANVIGVVMNFCDSEKSEYRYHSYYGSDPRGPEDPGEDAPIPE